MDGKWPADYAIDTLHGHLGTHRCNGSLPALVHDIGPPPGFAYAARYTVRSRDRSYTGEDGERTLDTVDPTEHGAGARGSTRAYQGADSWYRDDIYFPPGFQPTRHNDWNWLYELHNYPDGSGDANLALMVVTDNSDAGPGGHARLSVRVIGGGSPKRPIDPYGSSDFLRNRDVRQHWFRGPSVRTGHWYDLVWHIHWDWRGRAGGKGLAEYWIDGRKLGVYRGPNLFYYADNGTGHGGPGQAYLQHGYYRPVNAEAGYSQPTVVVYQAATMIGATAASIGEDLR